MVVFAFGSVDSSSDSPTSSELGTRRDVPRRNRAKDASSDSPTRSKSSTSSGREVVENSAEDAEDMASLLPSKIWYDSLEVGKTYRLSKETPLMPTWNPQGSDETIRAIVEHKVIPVGGSINIIEAKRRDDTAWYDVRAFDEANKPLGHGWVNSLALIGQDLEAR